MGLRDYQQESVDAAYERLKTSDNTVIVLPTGAGKSWVIAGLCQKALEGNRRVMVLQHRKELIQQNAEKIRELSKLHTVGVYSAGLRKKATQADVMVAGIQSVYGRANEFGPRNLIVIDECHRVSEKEGSQFQQYLEIARQMYPKMRVVGLTATPYRTGQGVITDGYWNSICYTKPVGELIASGHLSTLVTVPTKAVPNLSNVRMARGDFNQREMEDAYRQGGLTESAVKEMLAKANGRKSIIVFAAGVSHAEDIGECLRRAGETVEVVHGEVLTLERDASLRRFREGKSRIVVNVNVLTEGFDSPSIDCVAVMRATASPGLFAQAVGRGLRQAPGKTDCLILDYGGNVKRHGPIDSKRYGFATKVDGGGEAPIKKCDECGAENPASVRTCMYCGHEFPVKYKPRHKGASSVLSILEGQDETREVAEWRLSVHEKRGGKTSLRVSYGLLAGGWVDEWVCLEHTGFPRKKAVGWWGKFSGHPVPDTVEESIKMWKEGLLRKPKAIKVTRDGKYIRVSGAAFDTELPTPYTQLMEEAPF